MTSTHIKPIDILELLLKVRNFIDNDWKYELKCIAGFCELHWHMNCYNLLSIDEAAIIKAYIKDNLTHDYINASYNANNSPMAPFFWKPFDWDERLAFLNKHIDKLNKLKSNADN